MNQESHNSKARIRELTALWTQTNLAVRAFVSGVVHDSHAVDDILQEVAMTIVDKCDTFEMGTDFKAWVFAIARNHVMAYQKRLVRDRHVFDDEMLARLADAHVKLAPQYEDRRDAMRECIGGLEGRTRRVLDYKYRDQLKASRIAELEGVSANAVYMLLSRTRVALLECIEQRLGVGGEADA